MYCIYFLYYVLLQYYTTICTIYYTIPILYRIVFNTPISYWLLHFAALHLSHKKYTFNSTSRQFHPTPDIFQSVPCSKLLTPWNCTWTMFHLENRFNLHCKVIPSVIWTFYSNCGTKQVDGKWRRNRKIRLERHAAYTCLYGCFTARGRFLFQSAILEDFGRHEVQRASPENEPSYFCLRNEPAA